MKGRVLAPSVPLVTKNHQEIWATLALDADGLLSLGGKPLDVPSAKEYRRWGVTLVNLGALPRPWRPAHAPKGGVMIAALHAASPLALAGLRPFDILRKIGGKPPKGAKDAVHRLRGVRAEEEVALEVTQAWKGLEWPVRAPELDLSRDYSALYQRTGPRPRRTRAERAGLDGLRKGSAAFLRPVTRTLRVAAVDAITPGGHLYVPFVTESTWSRGNASFAVGPFDLLFNMKTRRNAWQLKGKQKLFSGYTDDLEWNALAGFCRYERRRDPDTGRYDARLHLFWFIPISWKGGAA